MLGKGSLGTVYKAVLEDGCTVAVKRLKDANPCVRKEYMDLIGNLRRPNLVHLRAYYYAKEEKLLVYDYLSKLAFSSPCELRTGDDSFGLDNEDQFGAGSCSWACTDSRVQWIKDSTRECEVVERAS